MSLQISIDGSELNVGIEIGAQILFLNDKMKVNLIFEKEGNTQEIKELYFSADEVISGKRIDKLIADKVIAYLNDIIYYTTESGEDIKMKFVGFNEPIESKLEFSVKVFSLKKGSIAISLFFMTTSSGEKEQIFVFTNKMIKDQEIQKEFIENILVTAHGKLYYEHTPEPEYI